MTEIVYLIKLINRGLSFLGLGLLLALITALPDFRSFSGLPAQPVMSALRAEVALSLRYSWYMQNGVAFLNWAQDIDPFYAPPLKQRDMVGAINVQGEKLWHKAKTAAKPWLALVGFRAWSLLGMLVVAAPLIICIWLIGRRRAWVLFSHGEPPSDAQRKTWTWFAGVHLLALGFILASPFPVMMAPFLIAVFLLVCVLVYPIRSSTAARL
jgi:hypothetical protein